MMMPENNNSFELNNNETLSDKEINNTEMLNSPEWLFAKKLSNIDDRFIEEYLAYEKKRRRARVFKQIRTAAACAACVCIAVGGVIFGAYKMGQSPEVPDVTEGSSALSSDSVTDTTSETSLYNEEDFVIDENGRLLAYLGNDTEVYIPDTVTEITADALNQSASADQIVKVHITSSTRHIDEKAFSELDSIEEVEIDEDNEHYYFCNGVLMLSDFSLQIAVSKEANNDLNMVLETLVEEIGLRRLESENKAFPDEFRVLLSKGEFYLLSEVDNINAYVPHFRFYVTSIEAFGNTYIPEEKVYIGSFHNDPQYNEQQKLEMVPIGNAFVKILMSDESFWFITFSPSTGNEDVLVFTKSGVEKIGYHYSDETPGTTNYLQFYYDENGSIIYTRKPAKYFTFQTMDGILKECVSRDELALEIGYITFENDEIIYNATAVYTISELLEAEHEQDNEYSIINRCIPPYKKTIDQIYEYLKENSTYNEETGYYEYGNMTLFATLDELLAYNSTIYKRAY